MIHTPRQQKRLRPYQTQAVKFLLWCKRGVVQAPAGSGKTVIAADAIAEGARRRTGRARVVWIAPTTETCQQAEKALRDSGAWDLCDIRIGCPTSPGMFLAAAECDLLVVDECHHAPAETWMELVNVARRSRWGLSATPFDSSDPDRNDAIREMFGDRIQVIGRCDLVADGSLAPASVLVHSPRCPGIREQIDDLAADLLGKMLHRCRGAEVDELERRATWQACASIGIERNPARDAKIVRLAGDHREDSTLILVRTVEHGARLAEAIPGAEAIHAKLRKATRRDLIETFRSGNLRALVATSLADEGLDVPVASALVLAAGGRSTIKVIQRTGRVLRPHPGKSEGTIHDFDDDFHPMLSAQARARQRIFRSLNYTIREA